MIRTGKGVPVPVPPQLLQAARPEPEHLRHPTSPSDHRVQKHVTLPVPLQVGQRGNGPPAIGFWSRTDLTKTAPAKTLRPVASWVMAIGPIVLRRERKKVANFGDNAKVESWRD